MRTLPGKILALSVIAFTVVSLLLSVFFLVQTWHLRKPMTERLQSFAKQSVGILETTQKGLDITEQVVTNIYSTTVTLEDSTLTFANSAQSSSQFIGSIGSFMGEGLMNTITNTQVAINSAQASAVVIDNILTAMSNIPFIGIKYNPSRPLNVALGEISTSLDPIKATMHDFEANLSTTQASMQEFQDQAIGLNQNIVSLNENLLSTRSVINSYQAQVKSLHTSMDNAATHLPGWVTSFCWLVTIFISWFILVQLAIILQAVFSVMDKADVIVPPNSV